MSDAKTVSQIYNSCFRHGIDEKRRVQIPAKWRPEQEGTELTMIPWPNQDLGVCLRVLPPVQMAQLMADIEAMPKGDEKKIYLKRFIGSESAQVTLDKAGRICIPDEMARKANIKDEAVLSGMLDRFEIWNPVRFEKSKAAHATVADEAFKLME
jgi:MraZ protein